MDYKGIYANIGTLFSSLAKDINADVIGGKDIGIDSVSQLMERLETGINDLLSQVGTSRVKVEFSQGPSDNAVVAWRKLYSLMGDVKVKMEVDMQEKRGIVDEENVSSAIAYLFENVEKIADEL